MMKLLSKSQDILPIREQYSVCDEVLKDRLEHLMPKLLRECGVDMWLVLCREYNEDPVFKTLTPQLVKNISDGCAQADGLSKQLYDKLYACLGDRIVPDDSIAIRWLETRTPRELELYPVIYRIAMDVLREAYSRDVITPGVTTTTDVEWYIMQRINDMGLDAWFSPDVDLQRRGEREERMCDTVIQEGDLLHTDMGLTYLNLYTDSQRLGYVLKKGETQIPAGSLKGFSRGNRFQDLVRENFVEGHRK